MGTGCCNFYNNHFKLLDRAYDFHDDVRRFYDLSIGRVLAPVDDFEFISKSNLPELMQRFSLTKEDSIRKMTDAILTHVEPIIELSDFKNIICEKLAGGTDEEQDILFAFELYHLMFPLYFSLCLSNFKNPLFLSILKRFHTHSCYYIVPSKSKATNLIITFFIYLSNNSTWISNCNTIRRNIFCNNTPCTYYSTISN